MRLIVSLLLTILTTTIFAKNADLPIYSDSQQIITVTSATPKFIIQLDANPTTGYSWFAKNYSKTKLKILTHQYFPPQQQIPGKGGYEEWVIQAKKKFLKMKGKTAITLIFQRPWEKQPLRKITFQVQVK